MPRRPLIAGNWKMNNSIDQALTLGRAVAAGAKSIRNVDIAIFPPYLALPSIAATLGDTRSLVIHPTSTTHRQLSPEQQVAAGAGPDVVRVSIGLESADHQEPWYDTDWLHLPDIHGGEVSAALVSGLVAPQSPDEYRWETLWGYQQGGPGVFKGDLHFYRADSDYRDRIGNIDTTQCPVYLLTGEYDYSCTPEDTLRTAARIKGAEATIMEGLGHFPMSEDPQQFRRYIIPILDKIRG